jgi:hypothetical protein
MLPMVLKHSGLNRAMKLLDVGMYLLSRPLTVAVALPIRRIAADDSRN